MRILYIFPHPDDESFGPAPAISKQRGEGHEVYLLTLTKGEATSQRERLGVSKKEMGEIRFKEMECVQEVLDLTGMTVWDWSDNQLKEADPIALENAIEAHIHKIKPDVIVTYAVHGISGFPDHLVSHAVVKRLFVEMQQKGFDYPRRLALFTLAELHAEQERHSLNTSPKEDIDCIEETSEKDMLAFNRALDCYETYQEVIRESKVREQVVPQIAFEIYNEDHTPPLKSLFDNFPD